MLKAEWEKRRALVEEGLVRELRTDEAFDARLAESMEYSLTVILSDGRVRTHVIEVERGGKI